MAVEVVELVAESFAFSRAAFGFAAVGGVSGLVVEVSVPKLFFAVEAGCCGVDAVCFGCGGGAPVVVEPEAG